MHDVELDRFKQTDKFRVRTEGGGKREGPLQKG